VRDHQHAAHLLGDFIDGAQKWARVGGPDHRPDRRRWRSRVGEGFELHYVYTHENSGVRGFHSHLLATVPAVRIPALKIWARQILSRLTAHPGTKETLDIDYSRHRLERDQVQWQWRMFRYVAKQCAPDVTHRRVGLPLEPAVLLRDLLQLNPYQSALPVRCPILSGVSRCLRAPARRAAGFPSWLFAARREQLYVGEELAAYHDRLREEHFIRDILPTLITSPYEPPFRATNYALPPSLRSRSDK
jgi:hypothetical protein